ncbi:clathrin light chain 2-like [Lycium barbarum]|uniref:clathrin light chain 2-like n=1 Tax=Lycium barbarum TaxID=112863 RepID=UPI00293E5BC8|nr:clathrin light chain 2-like [Lycium barbarum]
MSSQSVHDSDSGDFEVVDKDVTEDISGDHVFVSEQPMMMSEVDQSTGGENNGPILPPPERMVAEEGFALREWRRLNTIRLEEKEKREKEIVREIIEEAEEYKAEYYRKWKLRCENNIAANREKEKLFLANQEKFHAEANKAYWRAIGELIPKEVPTIEKKGKKKDKEKQPSIIVIQGPKPGRPTELSRMRQILVKLKHNPPAHMKSSPKPSLEPGKDAKTGTKTPAAAASAKPQATAAP